MQTGSSQSPPTSPTIQDGEKRPGIIDSAAYVQGLRVANVEIADISKEIKQTTGCRPATKTGRNMLSRRKTGIMRKSNVPIKNRHSFAARYSKSWLEN
jgi:hypothetical protein